MRPMRSCRRCTEGTTMPTVTVNTIARFELVDLARRCGFPRYQDECGRIYEGQESWTIAAWP
jgi:hypothetical protein